MNTRLFTFALLCSGALAAPFVPAFAASPETKSMATRPKSWVSLVASTDKARYRVGEPIQVQIRATNTSKNTAFLQFSSGQRFDFKVFNAQNENVYTWSAMRMFAQVLGNLVMYPGNRKTFQASIGDEMGQLPAGQYRLEAHLTNSSQIAAAPTFFEILPAKSAAPQTVVSLSATTDKRVYQSGEPIRINAKLANNSGAAKTFNFTSGQTHDAWLKDASGQDVWGWSWNMRFIMVSRPITLQNGETREFSMTFPGQSTLKPGKYSVQTAWVSQPENVRAAPIEVEIR